MLLVSITPLVEFSFAQARDILTANCIDPLQRFLIIDFGINLNQSIAKIPQ